MVQYIPNTHDLQMGTSSAPIYSLTIDEADKKDKKAIKNSIKLAREEKFIWDPNDSRLDLNISAIMNHGPFDIKIVDSHGSEICFQVTGLNEIVEYVDAKLCSFWYMRIILCCFKIILLSDIFVYVD